MTTPMGSAILGDASPMALSTPCLDRRVSLLVPGTSLSWGGVQQCLPLPAPVVIDLVLGQGWHTCRHLMDQPLLRGQVRAAGSSS